MISFSFHVTWKIHEAEKKPNIPLKQINSWETGSFTLLPRNSRTYTTSSYKHKDSEEMSMQATFTGNKVHLFPLKLTNTPFICLVHVKIEWKF